MDAAGHTTFKPFGSSPETRPFSCSRAVNVLELVKMAKKDDKPTKIHDIKMQLHEVMYVNAKGFRFKG